MNYNEYTLYTYQTQADHFPSYSKNDSLQNSETSARKENDSFNQLIGPLSPIDGDKHDLSSINHLSNIPSQAVSIGTACTPTISNE